ncbi:hypothetical protein ACJQWK_10090 [Exserohilum turcicum]|uniref:EGF-like domain-containing protein n=1 Tax=Exserohilum turcicum (strain 28A) TaxID=671987 RepID=R0K2R0_EXST2|nr:uncharacterized protein SETTUDRAFT_19945 [Exserohilum turcica Et28A]EOA87428.1 hypothetical protein SETTUDRAFT_19945 [Exserohilum turcica Et28A]
MKTLILALASLLALASATPTPNQPSPPATCPNCNPNPGSNFCDITTSCTVVSAHPDIKHAPYYCACRAGYRANGCDAGDSTIQWRLPWPASDRGPSQEGRVFVKPGVVCDTLCNDPYAGVNACSEVTQMDKCL